MIRPFYRNAALALFVVFLAGCGGGSKVSGVYSNAESLGSVEFLDGGRAVISLSGMGQTVPYTQSGKIVKLDWEGETVELTVEKDGSLTGPSGSFLARLSKKK